MVEENSVNNSLIGDNRKGGAIRLQIVPAQPKTLSHLPSRPAVDLAFDDLVYSVREGRRNRKYTLILLFAIIRTNSNTMVPAPFPNCVFTIHTTRSAAIRREWMKANMNYIQT